MLEDWNFKKNVAVIALGVFLLISVIYFSPSAQASPYQVEIQVRGTSGLGFSGSYGDLSGQQSVDGTVPETYTITDPDGDTVSATFQKDSGGSGTLTVKLVKNGEVAESKTTTSAYGVVSVSHNWTGGVGIGAGFGILAFFIIGWFFLAIILCAWVYKDAKARGENGALWLIIVLITGLLGLIIWLVVRPEKESQATKNRESGGL